METANDITWKKTKTLAEAQRCIDIGIILQWQELPALKKALTKDEQESVIRHFATRLCERADDRLASEIIVESVLVWFANATNDALVQAYFSQLFSEPEHDLACKAFAEIALTVEVTDSGHDEELYSLAVVFTCELGIAIHEYDKAYPGAFQNVKSTLENITTYLSSVSNNNNPCIRLSLTHYFGYFCSFSKDKSSFNRIMNRFGHTVLDHLFGRLFQKKSESIALQFLLENLPYVLEADNQSQRIFHDTCKYYMLKNPERFSLFLQTFSEHLTKTEEAASKINTTFLQHLGALFKVTSEVNHKILGREILLSIQRFDNNTYRQDLVLQISTDETVRQAFKELALGLNTLDSILSTAILDSPLLFRTPKRGRKPAFSSVPQISNLSQLIFLGNKELAKAS